MVKQDPSFLTIGDNSYGIDIDTTRLLNLTEGLVRGQWRNGLSKRCRLSVRMGWIRCSVILILRLPVHIGETNALKVRDFSLRIVQRDGAVYTSTSTSIRYVLLENRRQESCRNPRIDSFRRLVGLVSRAWRGHPDTTINNRAICQFYYS